MTDDHWQADFYALTGPGFEIGYRARDDELTVQSEDWPQHSGEQLAHTVTVAPDIGMLVTAVLLDSSRDGTRVTLTVVLPETDFELRRVPQKADVTGVAIVTRIFTNVVGDPPPVLQRFEAVALEGTVHF